jgi:predicted enzyme involved in methoxymalonyl-ACP biosynthesis
MRERVHQHDLGKGGGIAIEFFCMSRRLCGRRVEYSFLERLIGNG